jgi:flagellar biosynthesis protein FlhF
MQVKKFEARSMKEALEMIKSQLGPDAIILSAKEINKGFGLGGERSIEVTAAYSEAILRNKKFVESKLPTQDKEDFGKRTAKDQKEVMRKMIEHQLTKINSQNSAHMASHAKTTASTTPYKMTERRYADIDSDQVTPAAAANMATHVAKKAWNDMEVTSLKNEIESLKQVMSQFKSTVPQNFVQAHPGADYGVHYQMSAHFQKLMASGLMPEIAGSIVTQCQKQLTMEQQANRGLVESWMAKYILDTTPVTKNTSEQFHLFVGPSGSGKTSSLIKLASDMILNQKKRVAIISTDSSKVGAAEQMKIFAQILNVPFLTIRSQQDWSHVIPHLEQLDHVLVDFAGLNLRNQDEANYIKRMSPPVYRSMRTHLVLSSSSKDGDLMDCAKRYDEFFGFNDVIFTALDEASQHGNIYNFVRKTKTELFAFGIGQKVPEDFEYASAERVVDLLLKITQNKKQEASL